MSLLRARDFLFFFFFQGLSKCLISHLMARQRLLLPWQLCDPLVGQPARALGRGYAQQWGPGPASDVH